MCAFVRRFPTLTYFGRISTMSPAIEIFRGVSRPDARSYNWICPNCSRTIAPGPADADLKSMPAFETACDTFFVLVSYE